MAGSGRKGVPGSQAALKDVVALGGDLVILKKCVKMFTFSKKPQDFPNHMNVSEFGEWLGC